MTRRRFLSIASALLATSLALQCGAKEVPQIQPRYPHLEYEREEANSYTGERRYEIRVAHGPQEFTVASCPANDPAGRYHARHTAWHA